MNKMKLPNLIMLFLLTGAWGKKPSTNVYEEQLSRHRKQFNVVKEAALIATERSNGKKFFDLAPTHDVTAQLHALLQCKKAANEQIKVIRGHTIQAYTGVNRELALQIKNKLCTHFPWLELELHYDLPNYTVRAGKFLDKAEAYPMYGIIKKVVPQAIIRPIFFANKFGTFTKKQRTRSES